MSKEKVVLAYSGGLDTSVCVKWLQDEKNLDVVCVCGNVGQEETGLDAKKQKALDLGVLDCQVLDLRDEFSDEFLTKAIAANSMYENKYPLLSALSRPLLAKKLVEVAHEFGATYVAHGCTGKGNDQVRFEAAVKALDPELKVIAPVREWDLKCRPDEVAYAHAHNVPVPEGAGECRSRHGHDSRCSKRKAAAELLERVDRMSKPHNPSQLLKSRETVRSFS